MTVSLRRWTDADASVLVASNSAQMMTYLSGPETDERVRRRHEQYLRGWDSGRPRMFGIRLDDVLDSVGGIGWWESEWSGEPCMETGWSVLPAFQGRGIATRATLLVAADAAAHDDRRLLMACPRVDNVASNRVCRAAGFTWREERDDEYRGVAARQNVWTLDLRR